MRITFDSQAWQTLIFPERHLNDPNYGAMVRIKDALRNGKLEGFICESFGTLEAVKKKDRAAYLARKAPIITATSTPQGAGSTIISMQIESDHSLHPGFHWKLDRELDEALVIGVKLLSTPYFNLPVPDRLLKNPGIYAPEVFATAEYAERFGSVVSEIVARGVGEGALAALVQRTKQRLGQNRPAVKWDIELLEYVYNNSRDRVVQSEIEKVVAESADGHTAPAHIAFGSDFLCSEDRGRTAGIPSVFDAANRA